MRSLKEPAKLAMLLLLVLLLLCNRVGNVHGKTIHENSVDLHALLDFKKGITGPEGALSNWNTTTHFCRWTGVNCTTTPFRVSKLNLTGQNLQGHISPSLGNLTFLKSLDLSVNNFVGSIPLLNNLQHLRILFLQDNILEGIFPDALTNCSNLALLDLSLNQLTGVIPPRIGNLTKLKAMSLQRNNFTGSIPPALGTIATLIQVSLAENQLSGQIPHELWQMPNIIQLDLNENSLSGGIPQSLPNISSLVQLSLSVNMLSGALPSNIGDALPSLENLFLGGNTFTGHIPSSLGNASGLVQFDLTNNNFSGQIPSSFGKLSEMTILSLAGNKFEAKDSEGWKFFTALANCRYLNSLYLSNNQLEGAIPSSIGNLSINLKYLVMGGNKLSGIVPPSIRNLNNLIQVSLDYNNLTGTIGEWIGQLVNLQHLNLQSNNFVGTIPPTIGKLTQLASLLLGKNEFQGLIPSSLGLLSQLLKLDLSYNDLHGTIPTEAFSITTMTTCVLSYNKLEGPIPLDFSNLQQLTDLHLSSNRLTGEIPHSLGQCQELEIIQMDRNLLTGNIPLSFGNLKSLSMLNLSHNNLSGTIPTGLEDLIFLTQLDLSYNNLKGEVPANGIFQNNTALSLNNNWGLCGGSSYLHITPCSTVSLREVPYYLIRILIPIFGFMSIILLVHFILPEKKMPKGTYSLLLSFGKKFPKVSYSDLAQATENFSETNLVGRGSYGSVYKGKIFQAKMQVAIKVFDLGMRCADKTFISECEVLRRVRHINLVSVLTACSTIDNVGNPFKALIYEYMPNGNLDRWLNIRSAGEALKSLGLGQRINILVNVADALSYLHHDCEKSIVHCDLKPSNILLDHNLNAYLGDFGIANLVINSMSSEVGHLRLESSSDSSVGLKGTIGYMAPEYAQTGQASTCGDVYSFGIVLLEMLTGKRPTDPMFDNELNIVNFTERNYPDQILHSIDAHLQEECKEFIRATAEAENAVYQCLVSLVQVALSCTRPFPRERINMREVATKLHAARTSYVAATNRDHVMPR